MHARSELRTRARILLLMICAAAIPACSPAPPPITVSDCRAIVTANRIDYTFVLRNETEKTVAAIRLNYVGPADAESGITLDETHPRLTYDVDETLFAHASKNIEFHSGGLPRTTKPLRTQPLQCNIVAVRFTDGSNWTIAPGIALPQ